ncbi:MAG TPA: hypothetical protein DCK87_01955 [Desulfotomaculum sp.]|nr:hypothetical protein [Desulfotomaculum sp.]
MKHPCCRGVLQYAPTTENENPRIFAGKKLCAFVPRLSVRLIDYLSCYFYNVYQSDGQAFALLCLSIYKIFTGGWNYRWLIT